MLFAYMYMFLLLFPPLQNASPLDPMEEVITKFFGHPLFFPFSDVAILYLQLRVVTEEMTIHKSLEMHHCKADKDRYMNMYILSFHIIYLCM